jgi:cytochrome c-type biogenesis protein CcmH
LRCLVCQNQTIADSNATLAQDLRREVREMLEAGKTDAEIRDFMIERYGDFVLYRPRMTPVNFLLWGAPVLLLLLGTFVGIRIIRKQAASVDDESPEAGKS